MNYANTLESYLIPAEEAMSDDSKATLASMGIMAIIVAALGISQKFKNRKLEKENKSKSYAQQESREKFLKESFQKVDQKYKLSSMSKDEYTDFIRKLEDQIEIDVRKILRPLNSKDVLNKLKEDYIKDINKWFKDDPKYLESETRNAENSFRPGLFKIVENDGEYICIVDGDQSINTHCGDIVEDVAEALELKYSEFVAAGLFGVGTGDGDEGCIYPGFVSYETMRKRI